MNKIALFALTVATMSLPAGCIPNMRAAEEANQQHVMRMCNDPNVAYESGTNDGMRRRPLDTSWVDMSCHPEARAQVRESYQAGYHQGLQNAPIVVEGRGFGGGGTRYASSGGSECTFSSDCGDGMSCRQDKYGTNVCMGYGASGDACWFGSDCVSGSCNGIDKVCK